jgi:hypothetical protein
MEAYRETDGQLFAAAQDVMHSERERGNDDG